MFKNIHDEKKPHMAVHIGLDLGTCRLFLTSLSDTSAQLLKTNNAVERKRGPILVNRDR